MRVGKIEEAIALFEKADETGMAPPKSRADMAKAKLKYPGPSEKDIQEIKNIITVSSAAHLKRECRWAQFTGMTFGINSFATIGDGSSRRAVAWGIDDHTNYSKGSDKLSKFLSPWAMILTKEKTTNGEYWCSISRVSHRRTNGDQTTVLYYRRPRRSAAQVRIPGAHQNLFPS